MRKLLARFLRLPPDPDPPAGSDASVRVFRASKNFYYVLLVRWFLRQVGVVVGFLFAFFFVQTWSDKLPWYFPQIINVLEILALVALGLQIIFSFIMVHMDYQLRWYIVTDRSIRIRAGVWDIREMTMTFANIQHASVSQGPIQRALGISDLLVRSAGGGAGIEQASQHQKGAGEMMHVGYFHGVNNAEEIKELIQERMRRYGDTGLGDPDEEASTEEEAIESPSQASALLEAARGFAEEARLLRSTWSSRTAPR